MVKGLPEFEFFLTVFLKNRKFIFKIRISKVTDYAALNTKYRERHMFAIICVNKQEKKTVELEFILVWI